MPRNSRDYLLRHHDQAQNDLDRALERLGLMAGMYGSVHPKHTEFCRLAAFKIIQVKEELQLFKDRYM